MRRMILILLAGLVVSVGACQKTQDATDAVAEKADETATNTLQMAGAAAGNAGEIAANALQLAGEVTETAADAVQMAGDAAETATETAADAVQVAAEEVEEAEAVIEDAGELANVLPEKVTLDACIAKKSAVDFPHAKHVDITECTTCHHTQEVLTAETVVEVASCSSCHLDPAEAETPNCTAMSTKTNPYHITCIGCHKEKVAEDAASPAPTKCDGCHPKAG